MIRRWLVGVAALLAVFLWAAPVQAHTGALNLDVADDGADGITVRATYQDGHPAEPTIRLSVVASGEGGRQVGPVQMTQSGEGRGFYSTGSMLAPGHWQIVVTAPEPHSARVELTLDAKPPQSPPRVAATPTTAGGSGAGWVWWVVGAAAVGGAVVLGVLAIRRPRATATR